MMDILFFYVNIHLYKEKVLVCGGFMKKLIFYAGIMFSVIILLPLLIVKGCSYSKEEPSTPQKPELVEKIKIYNSATSSVMEMELEDYLKGVVAAEMPADFDLEALKAQAVAARTFTYGRLKAIYPSKEGIHDGIAICTDHTHCQAWTSKEDATKRWGFFRASANWSKIEKAVSETKGMIITYDNKIINALYHANSGGKTENCEEVWEGAAVPYLKSVTSYGENTVSDYKVTINLPVNDFIKIFNEKYPDSKLVSKNLYSKIKILDYTTGGRVKTIKIGDITMKGTDFRILYNLRSANFKIEKAGKENFKITTIGYGHGVGMSQWGANWLAKRGGTYDEILRHYYTGVDIVSIDKYESATVH
jgi:stage II sporulation protein D